MTAHPQRSGRSLFLLWAAGLLVQAVLMRVATFAANSATGGANEHALFLFIGIAIAAHAWQAWLLFRPGWRFALWTALPLMGLVAPDHVKWIEMQSIIAPLVQTALLANVRQRPWAWLLAGMGQVIVGQLGYRLISNLSYSMGSRYISWPIVLDYVVQGGISGLWLLGELAAAAVLAWWMPPVGAEKRVESQN